MNIRKKHSRHEFMNNIMDDEFHPCAPVCNIIRTTTQKKQNIFKKFRPQPDTVLDYDISQTDTKLDAGDTKIHLQETIAKYVPTETQPKPKRIRVKKTKYFSGGPPKWIFVDEVWLSEQEKKQKEFHAKFKIMVKNRLKEAKFSMNSGHQRVVKLVGPAWYQELSPRQIATVEDLRHCILKDLAEDTIINTQENIAYLGLVLRPNHRHIKKALKNCCKCPVEFLLILYQLINPNRKKYSINDRLLLSGVVHLTMMSTLRELHVRIPSPPRPPVVVKKATIKKKKVKYPSPYLVPYTFVKKPPKFSGIYTNKHVQRPQSPYFCYLAELKRKIEIAGKGTHEDVVADSSEHVTEQTSESQTGNFDDDIENELRIAQNMYAELVNFKPVPKLLKPSRYIPCDNFRNKTLESETQEETEEVVDDTLYCVCAGIDVSKRSVSCECSPEPCYFADDEPESCVCAPQENTCGCVSDGEEPESIQNTCGCDLESKKSEEQCTYGSESAKVTSECFSEGRSRGREDKCHYEDQPGSCGCNVQPSAENKKEKNIKSTGDECESPENIQSPRCGKYKEREEEPCKHAKNLQLYDQWYHLLRPGGQSKQPCSCKQKYKKFIQTPLCQCKQCQDERRMKNITYIITGMKETESHDVIPIIDRVVEGKLCDCLKKYENKIIEYELDKEVEDKILCKCQKAVQQMLDTPLCQCPRCKENRRSRAAKFIIKGVKQTDSETFHIIEGISMGKPCDCMKEYEKRAKKYQVYKQGKDVMTTMKRQEHKYVIGGVASTPRGPKYVITGMRPPIDCTCAKQARQEAKERHMQAIMPHVPGGRIQYQIVGVKETPKGNVYVLDSALKTPDCDCMAIFKTFEQQHSVCMHVYEQYLAKMKDDYNQFMNEMLPPSSSRRSSRGSNLSSLRDENKEKQVTEEEEIENENEEIVKSENKVEEVDTGEKLEEDATATQVSTHELEPQKPEKSSDCKEQTPPCSRTCGTGPAFCECGNPFYLVCCECCKVQRDECVQCTCGGQVIECVDCTCGDEEIEEEKTQLKRFFIFDKISCKHKWQMNVLKKALQSMADDNFPLAKLPECYKLPHFKLWMQMRCRKFWTQHDKYKYIFVSKYLWRHCDSCDIWRYHSPDLKISKETGSQLNWFHADYVRFLVHKCLGKFYRNMRQNRINFGREFFPTTFSYNFPFKTWRDCYFAYTPTKEENVLARFVWQKHHAKNFAEMQRFCKLQ
ncbi:uncharacterized protein LOC135139296 [Zophobas morio]|uniref:uncharacterized protein LOC135139296 n=1 Tax=Zophobas morio TaxID=2755281 RepID=UPI003083CFB2